MPDEEVKIHVRSEADMRGVVDAKAKVMELREEAAKLRQSADVYSQKGGFEDSRARSARAEAATREREADRLERPIKSARLAEEKEITRERREQAAISRAEETQQQAGARMLFGGRRGVAGGLVGGVVGAGLGFGLQEFLTERTGRQGIALRAAAQRQMDERGLAIAGSWRGSSSQTLAQVHGLADDIAHQQANRPELERKANAGTMQGALSGASAGAGIGAAIGAGIGSIIPGLGTLVVGGIGAAIGAGLGGAAGAWRGHAAGEREKDEDSKKLELKRKIREELEALGKKQVREEDGQITMDLASHRAERTMSGSRAAVIDQQKQQFLNRYRELRGMNLSDGEAKKTAGLEAETSMRERQAAAGASLVTAHSGAGDIAAAARWAGMSTPGMAETKAAIDALHTTVKDNSRKSEELAGRKDQSVQ